MNAIKPAPALIFVDAFGTALVLIPAFIRHPGIIPDMGCSINVFSGQLTAS
jgi:hypothetical protein